MTRKTKRKRRIPSSKSALRPDVTHLIATPRGRFSKHFFDATLVVGAALGLLVAFFTGLIAPGAFSHRGRFSLP